MAQVELKLSSKVQKETGRSEILMRIRLDKNRDVYSGTRLFVQPHHFLWYIDRRNSKKLGIDIPARISMISLDNANKKGYPILQRGEVVIKELVETPDVCWDKQQKVKLDELLKIVISSVEAKSTLTSEELKMIVDKFHNPSAYLPKNEKKLTIYELGEIYLEKKDFQGRSVDENGKQLTHSVRAFRVIMRALARYEAFVRQTDKKRKKFTLDVDTITREDLEDFQDYFRNEAALQKEYPIIFDIILKDFPTSINVQRKTIKIEERGYNTIWKITKRIKYFFNWLNQEGYTKNQPFKGWIMQNEKYETTPYFLTVEERNALADYDLSAYPSLEAQRDIFVFQCLVGCRVGDLLKFREDNIVNGILSYIPSKTRGNSEPVQPIVPLNERALALVVKYKGKDKHGRLFPFISAQKYNEAIKQALTMCGITRNVIVVNPTNGKEEKRPLNEIASSHMARRTFVGNLYFKVKDPNLIGKMSGHVEGSTAFARYRDIDEKTLKETISLID